MSGKTDVVIGGAICEVTNISFSSVTCVTTPRNAASVDIVVISNGRTYPNPLYEYSNDSTPYVTRVSPDNGNCLNSN